MVSNFSYAAVVTKGKTSEDVIEEEKETPFFSYSPDLNLKNRRKKSYIGEVLHSGESYNIQTHLEIEGFLLVKVIPLGANLCLLGEMEEEVIQELLNDPLAWWKQWFWSIRQWQEREVDSERIMWVRVHGVPSHVWSADIFVDLANGLGSYVCLDDNTLAGSCMDISRLIIRVPFEFSLNNYMKVAIDGSLFTLIFREDTFGPVRIVKACKSVQSSILSSSFASDLQSQSDESGNRVGEEDDYASIGDSQYKEGEEKTIGGEETRHKAEEDIKIKSSGKEGGAGLKVDLRMEKEFFW